MSTSQTVCQFHRQLITLDVYCHVAENVNPTDITCQVCGHQFYDPKMLNRHNELYSWECLSCGECLKF